MLPLTYSLRNIGRFPWKTLQMLLGATIVVFLIVGASALNRGITECLSITGDSHNVMVMGAGSEESIQRSEINRTVPDILASSLQEIRRILDRPAVSSEVYYMGMTYFAHDPLRRSALFRGVTYQAINTHRNILITRGHFPGPGEVMVGRQVAKHLNVAPEHLAIGKTLFFEGMEYRIAGHFQGQGTLMEAEIWMDINDLLTAAKRETVSCATVALNTPGDADAISLFCNQRIDLELAAVREQDYYAALATYYKPIRIMVWLSALMVAAAAVFSSINTAYAAIILRRRELATLQTIGATPGALVVSLAIEMLMIHLVGAMLAMVIASLWLPSIQIAFSTGVFNMVVDNWTLLLGFGSAILLSLVGIILPAWGCLKPAIVSSLRSS